MQRRIYPAVILLTLSGLSFADNATGRAEETPQQATTSESTGEPQQSEETKTQSALDRRIEIERETRFQPFVLTAHKPNYLLPYTYNETPNQSVYDPAIDGELDKTEIKFQFSIKFPITDELFGNRSTLYFAYTNLSFWQAYNRDISSPFRETNHEPEIFMSFPTGWEFYGITNRLIQVGISHQSNGRSGDVSRSWNRIYADFILQKGDFYLSIKPWLRIEPNTDDDNPDILDYMGHGELRLGYATGKHTLSIMLRNQLRSSNQGAVELNYSYPMSRRVKWFFQYFDGYGESLIDYNARVTRYGIGIAMTDWL